MSVLASPFRNCSLIHLAAKAAVQVDGLDAAAEMIRVNELGFINTLKHLSPRRVVLASSGAVYGNEHGYQLHGTPVGLYGSTKNSDEKLLRLWAQESGGLGYIMRFGNVVGARCRGLVPYLVKHAKQYPNAERPALCRGDGSVGRDYVPVEYVASVLVAALSKPQEPAVYAFDIASGFVMTNGEVGEIVTRELARAGFKMVIDWSAPLVLGETQWTHLDPARVEAHFPELRRPDRKNVEDALREAVQSYL